MPGDEQIFKLLMTTRSFIKGERIVKDVAGRERGRGGKESLPRKNKFYVEKKKDIKNL